MWFILSFFLFFFARVQCDNEPPTTTTTTTPQEFENRIIASVKEYPTLLHKCTASFISYGILITTARCLYCEDECKLFLYALSDHLISHNNFSRGMLVNISKSIVHPEYERNPQRNDVGLIKLEKNLLDAEVISLPTKIHDESGLIVNSFSWQFTKNLMDYHLKKLKEQTISRALCSLVLNRYIDYKHICSRRKQHTTLGSFDQGSPLITKENGRTVLVGIFTSEVTAHESKVEVYQTVFPYVDWIREMISCDLNCSQSSPTISEKNQLFTTSNPKGQAKSIQSTTSVPYETTQLTPFHSRNNFTNNSNSLPFEETDETTAEYFTLKPKKLSSSSSENTIFWESMLDEPAQEKKKEFKNTDENKLKPLKWTTPFHLPRQKKTILAPRNSNDE